MPEIQSDCGIASYLDLNIQSLLMQPGISLTICVYQSQQVAVYDADVTIVFQKQ